MKGYAVGTRNSRLHSCWRCPQVTTKARHRAAMRPDQREWMWPIAPICSAASAADDDPRQLGARWGGDQRSDNPPGPALRLGMNRHMAAITRLTPRKTVIKQRTANGGLGGGGDQQRGL